MFEPSLHLHFEISNDCSQCCPRVLRCCCCCSADDDEPNELIVKGNKRLVAVNSASKKTRKVANEKLYNEVIPNQIGYDTWKDIRDKVSDLSGVDFDREIAKGKPVTKAKLEKIGSAIDRVIEDLRESQC